MLFLWLAGCEVLAEPRGVDDEEGPHEEAGAAGRHYPQPLFPGNLEDDRGVGNPLRFRHLGRRT
jgi:hypothetical protein